MYFKNEEYNNLQKNIIFLKKQKEKLEEEISFLNSSIIFLENEKEILQDKLNKKDNLDYINQYIESNKKE